MKVAKEPSPTPITREVTRNQKAGECQGRAMEGEGEEGADEETHVTWPGIRAHGCSRSEEDEKGGRSPNPELEGEVEELVVGVAGGIEHSVETYQDGLDRARAVAPEGEEVVEDPPHHPAEVIGGVMGEQGDPGQGARGGV